MNELVPQDLEADSTASVDGFTYTVTLLHDEMGYRARLTWQDRQGEQITPPFSNARSAIIEGHALAEEYILACRRSWRRKKPWRSAFCSSCQRQPPTS